MVALLAVLVLAAAATYRPAWYQPPAIDYERLHDDKAALAALQDEISAALNSGREIRFQLDEAQLNRWLAARAEIWPESLVPLANFEQPVVRLRAGQIELGATGQLGGWRGVITVTGGVAVNNDRLEIQLLAAHVGTLPVPSGRLCESVAKSAAGRGQVARTGDSHTLSVPNDWIWPNGKRRCRVRELTLRDGVVEIVLTPWRGD